MPDRALAGEIARLIRHNQRISALINTLFSALFFLALFGWPGRWLTLGTPDRLALDSLPQAGMVGLMSALVPPLIERRAVARLTGHAPLTLMAILRRAAIWAGVALLGGAILAGALVLAGPASIHGWIAFPGKLAFGGALGSSITGRVLRRMTSPDDRDIREKGS